MLRRRVSGTGQYPVVRTILTSGPSLPLVECDAPLTGLAPPNSPGNGSTLPTTVARSGVEGSTKKKRLKVVSTLDNRQHTGPIVAASTAIGRARTTTSAHSAMTHERIIACPFSMEPSALMLHHLHRSFLTCSSGISPLAALCQWQFPLSGLLRVTSLLFREKTPCPPGIGKLLGKESFTVKAQELPQRRASD